MIIRNAQLEDLPLLSQLFDAYRQFYQQPADLNGAHKFLKQRLESNESVIFVAAKNDQLLGFTQLFPSFSSVSLQGLWILNDLFVDAEARRLGVAKKLMNMAKQWADKTSSKGLVLETDRDNIKAQGLYKKLGYVKQDSTCHYFLAAQESARQHP